MRALLAVSVFFVLTACIDWETARSQALCAKAGVCTDGGTGAGSAVGGGTGQSSGGGAQSGGGSALGGGTASSGGGTTGGGTSTTGGGAGGGDAGVAGPGCTASNGIIWCPLEGTFDVPQQHPYLHLVDCSGGRVCFCATTASGATRFGSGTSAGGVDQHDGGNASACFGIAYGAPHVWLGLQDTANESYSFVPGDTSLTFSRTVTDTDFVPSGLVVTPNRLGAFTLRATGTNAVPEDTFVSLDFSDGTIHPGSAPCSGVGAEVFDPVAIPDGGAVVPYLAACGVAVGVVSISATDVPSEPYNFNPQLSPRTDKRTAIAVTSSALWVAWQLAGSIELVSYPLQGEDPLNDLKPKGDDLVQLLAEGDQSIIVVTKEFTGVGIVRLPLFNDGGITDPDDAPLTTLDAEPTVQSAALLIDGSSLTVALAGVCIEAGALCLAPGQAFIGFYSLQ